MEKPTGLEYLVIAGAAFMVVIAISFILFMIRYNRKLHKLSAINDILEKQNNESIQRIIRENKEIKKELAEYRKKLTWHN